MLVRKNQIKKKIYKVLIYPKPYEYMVEAVDRITAKQEAVNRLGIRVNDIYRITASTQAERKRRECTCASERVSTKNLIEKGYI